MDEIRIGIIGLGYVGLPLALAFGNKFQTIGFDINKVRISQLRSKTDINGESETKEFESAKFLNFTSKISELSICNFYVVTVPTPVKNDNSPDLTYLYDACDMLGKIMKNNDIIIFESTVFPGVTEEICAPRLQKVSGLSYNKQFFCGYSPERINPGDKMRSLKDIIKITSGSTAETAKKVDKLYSSIIDAGTYLVSNIKVAEASKVIENTQRDLNIAFMNELSKIFRELGIDTHEVLNAAETKWNFNKFFPGLVGGHCIGVDPYYLTHKAQIMGLNPELILSGRRVNDGMAKYITNQILKEIMKNKADLRYFKVLVCGLTFKEDCADTRNSKTFEILEDFEDWGLSVDIFEPYASKGAMIKNLKNHRILEDLPNDSYDLVLFSVGHQEFKNLSIDDLKRIMKPNCIFVDLKSIFNLNELRKLTKSVIRL